jgi:hypothetical protein
MMVSTDLFTWARGSRITKEDVMPCFQPPNTGKEWIVHYDELQALGELHGLD